LLRQMFSHCGRRFVAVDLVNPPHKDVHIRYKRFVLPHLEMLLPMGCGLAKSAATSV